MLRCFGYALLKKKNDSVTPSETQISYRITETLPLSLCIIIENYLYLFRFTKWG